KSVLPVKCDGAGIGNINLKVVCFDPIVEQHLLRTFQKPTPVALSPGGVANVQCDDCCSAARAVDLHDQECHDFSACFQYDCFRALMIHEVGQFGCVVRHTARETGHVNSKQ